MMAARRTARNRFGRPGFSPVCAGSNTPSWASLGTLRPLTPLPGSAAHPSLFRSSLPHPRPPQPDSRSDGYYYYRYNEYYSRNNAKTRSHTRKVNGEKTADHIDPAPAEPAKGR